jgi:hypothetical protein
MHDGPTASKPARYISFKDIDCEGGSKALIERILLHINDPAKTNAYWEAFKGRLTQADAMRARTADGLCLLCASVSYIDELFEDHDDDQGLALLRQLEDECC